MSKDRKMDHVSTDGVAKSGRALHAVRAVLHKDIVTSATHSAAGVLKDSPVVNWKDTDRTIPVDRNTVGIPRITTIQVRNGTGPYVPPIIIGRQNIEGPRWSIIPTEVRNSKPLNASINIFPAKHRYPKPSWIKFIASITFTNETANVYARIRMNFRSDTVLFENPNFMDFRLSSITTTDELGPVFVTTTRIGSPTDGTNWLLLGHDISEATVDIVSRTKTKNQYNYKIELETRRDKR